MLDEAGSRHRHHHDHIAPQRDGVANRAVDLGGEASPHQEKIQAIALQDPVEGHGETGQEESVHQPLHLLAGLQVCQGQQENGRAGQEGEGALGPQVVAPEADAGCHRGRRGEEKRASEEEHSSYQGVGQRPQGKLNFDDALFAFSRSLSLLQAFDQPRHHHHKGNGPHQAHLSESEGAFTVGVKEKGRQDGYCQPARLNEALTEAAHPCLHQSALLPNLRLFSRPQLFEIPVPR